MYRFYNPRDAQTLDHDIELPLDDNVQLTVEQYRTRLYDVSAKLQMLIIGTRELFVCITNQKQCVANKANLKDKHKNSSCDSDTFYCDVSLLQLDFIHVYTV